MNWDELQNSNKYPKDMCMSARIASEQAIERGRNERDIKKGDTVVYSFAYGLVEAKVIKVIGDDYLKVKHKDFCIFGYVLSGFKDIMRKDRILSVERRC